MAWELETKVFVMSLVAFGIFTSLILFYSNINTHYTVNGYTNGSLNSGMTELYDNIKTDTDNMDSAVNKLASGNLLDILGGLLQGVFGIIKTFVDVFVSVGSVGISALAAFNLGPGTALWGGIISLAVLIIFLVSVALRRIRG